MVSGGRREDVARNLHQFLSDMQSLLFVQPVTRHHDAHRGHRAATNYDGCGHGGYVIFNAALNNSEALVRLATREDLPGSRAFKRDTSSDPAGMSDGVSALNNGYVYAGIARSGNAEVTGFAGLGYECLHRGATQ